VTSPRPSPAALAIKHSPCQRESVTTGPTQAHEDRSWPHPGIRRVIRSIERSSSNAPPLSIIRSNLSAHREFRGPRLDHPIEGEPVPVTSLSFDPGTQAGFERATTLAGIIPAGTVPSVVAPSVALPNSARHVTVARWGTLLASAPR